MGLPRFIFDVFQLFHIRAIILPIFSSMKLLEDLRICCAFVDKISLFCLEVARLFSLISDRLPSKIRLNRYSE